ncbi:MAG: hypothetical protein COZ49_02340, partial [Candidatus Yonathbacteria bacterium CG_4_10_14_3_um_filter_47_65]
KRKKKKVRPLQFVKGRTFFFFPHFYFLLYFYGMNRKITFAPGEFYHLYNRGTDKRDIFISERDYRRFTVLLYLCNNKDPVNMDIELKKGRTFSELLLNKTDEHFVDIGAYCLMPNHFHLLVRERDDCGITNFMRKLSTAYSMYFNKKNDRSGTLFEGKFKAKHANDDNYLKYLFSYIHLNPIKMIDPHWKENGIADRTKAKNYLKTYHYSSYLDYIGSDRAEQTILKKSSFPDYFRTAIDFENFVDELLSYKNEVGS